MKFGGVILCILLSFSAAAQRLHGLVVDKSTNEAIPNAIVTKGYTSQLTKADGDFIFPTAHLGDTIKVTSMGYKSAKVVIGMAHRDTMIVYLEPNSIVLNNVNVNGQRNHKLDSINTRKEFARIFNYKAPKLTDAMVTVDPYEYHPNNYIDATNSTASLVGIDLLSVVNFFSSKQTADTKLHEEVIRDEESTYIDHRFSKQKVTAITKLQGDSLQKFIDRFRPRAEELKKMSDYDVLIFIKQCYELYLKDEK